MGIIEEIESANHFEEINDDKFTYYSDYDLNNLSSLSDDQKIEWFKRRMYVVFLKPLSIIFDRNYPNHSIFRAEFNETNKSSRNILIGAFSIFLNGIEACGSYMTPDKTKNKERFKAYLEKYLKNWLSICPRAEDSLDILWKNFRNGIAHGFCIEKGGIEYLYNGKLYEYKGNMLKIDPQKAFEEFTTSLERFFSDANNNPKSNVKCYFINRFNHEYQLEQSGYGVQ